jgi:biopolymer transport protein ExbD
MPLKIQHDETPALNLTSMIDVLFLLIIFFMVATKFDELERNIQVAVPQVSVIIRGDAKCAFQDVASALAACREAGISELGITLRIAGFDAPAVR